MHIPAIEGYRPSQFNIACETESDKLLVYNTFSGSLVLFDNDAQTIEDESTRDGLISQGILVSEDSDEVSRVLALREDALLSVEKEHLYFEIAPTLNCQASCRYCFQNELPSRPIMNSEKVEDVCQFMRNRINISKPKTVHITWFGGEPTLNLNAVYSIGSFVKRYCDISGITFHSSMITNGILLSAGVASRLVHECNLTEVQISLDGTRGAYALEKGIDAYNRVVLNISEIAHLVSVVVRLNVSVSNSSIIDETIEDLLVNHGLDGRITVYLARIEDLVGRGTTAELSIPNERFNELYFKLITKYIHKYQSFDERCLIPRVRRVFCPLECRANVLIGPDGSFYDCEESLGYRNYSFGDLSSPKGLVETQRPHSRSVPSTCLAFNCPLLPSCLGGCPSKKTPCSCKEDMKSEVRRRKAMLLLAAERIIDRRKEEDNDNTD